MYTYMLSNLLTPYYLLAIHAPTLKAVERSGTRSPTSTSLSGPPGLSVRCGLQICPSLLVRWNPHAGAEGEAGGAVQCSAVIMVVMLGNRCCP